MSEQDSPVPLSLSDQMLAYYREVIRDHGLNSETGQCPTCLAHDCTLARYAAERLHCAESTGFRAELPPEERLRQAMAARVARGELPGLVTVLARGDDVRVDAIGYTEFDDGVPMARDTPFRIGAMTQAVLAVAGLMLVEDGRLDLGEPVHHWLPELADRRVLRRVDGPLDDTVPADRPITVEDLLTSKFGYGLVLDPDIDPAIPVFEEARRLELAVDRPDPRSPHGPDEWLRRFATLPLMYQPGERWLYHVAPLILGILVSRAAGQSLPDFCRDRVFEPLDMHHTGFSLPADLAARLPGFYLTDYSTGKLERRPVSSPADWTQAPVFPSGASGLVSTADDFLAFARMLLHSGIHEVEGAGFGRELLSSESVRLMTTNHLGTAQRTGGRALLEGHGWGYGVAVTVEPSTDAGRYGWNGGYGTLWFTDPHRDLIAIALTQTGDFLFNGAAEFTDLAAATAA